MLPELTYNGIKFFKINECLNYGDCYLVSKCGEIYSKSSKSIKTKHIKDGYYTHTLMCWSNGSYVKRRWSTARIVAFTFLDLVSGKDFVNHIDGNKLNNNVSNLEWCDRSENTLHALNTGLYTPHGAGRISLTKEEKIKILELSNNGLSNRKIAPLFDTTAAVIGKFIKRYIKYGQLALDYKRPSKVKNK